MSHYTLFIADLHLERKEPQKTQLFLQFLKKKAVKTDAIYILGDFFEYWAGDDDHNSFIRNIKSLLKAFTETGVKIYLMGGNRDFLLGEKFAADTGVTLLHDPTRIDLYGRPVLLTHGDILCTKDSAHMFFSKYARNPKYQRFFLHLPLWLRKGIAKIMRFLSMHGKLRREHDKTDVVLDTVIKMMRAYGVHEIIHGHTHKEAINEVVVDDTLGRRIVLGNWSNKRASVLIYRDNNEVSF